MPWHAFTFEGLDATPTETASGEPGVVTEVNAPLVNQVMAAIGPHIQKSVSAGLIDVVKQNKKVLILSLGGVTLATLALLWTIQKRLRSCCPSRPMGNCCG